MWRCPKCGESIEDTFDACWKCGTAPAGQEDPGFQADPEGETGEGSRLNTREANAPPVVAEPVAARHCMTRLEIAELACRIMALWVFAQCALAIVPAIVLPIAAVFQPQVLDSLLTSVFTLLVPLGELVFGILLWKKAAAIARRMVSPDPEPVVITELDRTSLMTVAFAVIGIYAVWWSLQGLFRMVSAAYYMAQAQGLERAAFWSNTSWKAQFFGLLGSLAFALWLLFGSRGIVRFVQRVRGNVPAEEENTADSEGAK